MTRTDAENVVKALTKKTVYLPSDKDRNRRRTLCNNNKGTPRQT